jgi:hypothetical protein
MNARRICSWGSPPTADRSEVAGMDRVPNLFFRAAALLLAACVSVGFPGQFVAGGEVAAQPVPAVAAPRKQLPDMQFDLWVFGTAEADTAREDFASTLALRVQDIDRVCRLTKAQKSKMELTGRGDITRFYDRYDRAREKFKAIQTRERDDSFKQAFQNLWVDIEPLRTDYQAGLFDEDSLFERALRHTLSADQLAKYEAAALERRRSEHRASIESMVASLKEALSLRDSQRQRLIDLLTREIKPPRKPHPAYYYWRLGRMPKEKLEPLFDPLERKTLDGMLTRYRTLYDRWEPSLKTTGRPSR